MRVAARRWSGHVFIGMSVDGFIARTNGDLEWLTSRGEAAGDAGYGAFIAEIDHLVIGRVTYQTVLSFGAWPYEGMRVLVLSRALAEDDPRVRVVRSVADACRVLDDDGAQRVYVDGGQVIQAFLAADLIDDLTLTSVPVLIGDGVHAFGPLPHDVALRHLETRTLDGGLVQSRYGVGPAGDAPPRDPD